MTKEGYVEKVIYSNNENGYAVFTVDGEDGEDIFVGNLHGVTEGMYISAEGEYVQHPQYDIQFKFSSYKIKLPDDLISIEKYLGSGILKGVGAVLAKRIVNTFKMDSLRIIEEEPERLAEVKGITERKAREIAISFNEKKEMQDALIYLTGCGISISHAIKIYNEYGNDLYETIQSNPYKIAEDISGIGFKAADGIAEKLGVNPESDYRIRAAILYTLLNGTILGHMYLPKSMLVAKIYELLTDANAPYDEELAERISDQIVELQVDNKIQVRQIADSDEEPAVYSSANYYIELNSARMLLELDVNFTDELGDMDNDLEEVCKTEDIILEEKQVLAVKNAMKRGVAVITGGPGTGKTTIINTLIKMYERMEKMIMLAAPTGRAAKRITESTGYKAQTIHRMLGLTMGGEEGHTHKFEMDASNPLETDVIIVDEMSMVDASIFDSLLQAITPGTRLILVGDKDQLPSVGAGNVLKDIIKSEAFSVTVLDKIFRQSGDSDIITNAHLINEGKYIQISDKSKDFFYVKSLSVADIIEKTQYLLKEGLPKFFGLESKEIQVITPMRKYDLGVENLNKCLQESLNSDNIFAKSLERNNIIFREGDKVMQIKNNYQMEWRVWSEDGRHLEEEGLGVFNGDMGTIKSIDTFIEVVQVEFDDGHIVDYSFKELDELEHAYAITVHKSQGSEYPVVVIPILKGTKKLFNRNLLYTAVTRARKGVVIVGDIGMVYKMIDNSTEQKRFTSFAERIKELVQYIHE